MIDIGVNLDHKCFLSDLTQFAQSLQTHQIDAIIAISSSLTEARMLSELRQQHPDLPIYQTVGYHPHYASQWHTNSAQDIHTLVNSCRPVAIGETGLDFNRNFSTPTEQIYAFEQQIQLAHQRHLPLYLHERDALDTMLATLNHQPHHGGVIHCFTGDKIALKRYLDLGLYIGITGWVCDERRGDALQESVRYIPQDRLLLETDAPYLVPRTIRPRPSKNHPKYLFHVASMVATLRQETVEHVMRYSHENAVRLFRLDT